MDTYTRFMLDYGGRSNEDLIIDIETGAYNDMPPNLYHDFSGIYLTFMKTFEDTEYTKQELLVIFKCIVEMVMNEHLESLTFVNDIICSTDVLLMEIYRIDEVHDTLMAKASYIEGLVMHIKELTWPSTKQDKKYIPFIWNIIGDINRLDIVRLGVKEKVVLAYNSRDCRYSIGDYSMKKFEKEESQSYIVDITNIFEKNIPILTSLGLNINLAIITLRYMIEEFIITFRHRISEDMYDSYTDNMSHKALIDIESYSEKISNDFSEYMRKYYYEDTKKLNILNVMKTMCENEIYDELITSFISDIYTVVTPDALNREFVLIPLDWYVKASEKTGISVRMRILL